jgi:hypothetical protein
MKNPAIAYLEDRLNPFTEKLKDICDKSGKCLVKLNLGELVYVKNVYILNQKDLDNFYPSDYVIGDFIGFVDVDNKYNYYWNRNGLSNTSKSLSILKIVNNKGK